ncbi:heme lyase NrfEFG subunit NrfF [Shewanella fidelis]|uniref:Formate-dependent nitrite reductase complex subunit n=1 Tax=Shewanella fidelis TaxID=173509 RepID=A0AAW8NX81_9GAMM|nr:heme lyase NrfEFG subunit NrfF [Shewanella fidelis]MDR8526068.1 heme lyase NrfEFG subunit NrfF [Shewanella fidelis]MDW4813990.1 heme lyase NrfEFG subunit NrfF [Shewanella fidelis]MDW4818161.1 heme lyase NrfEFG subunit NrfF [Shewanella fidelis]MDW4822331.1 heme lyase NrfEFG subunit NrfF [Shewanella fidelis]MDW4826417.1 heme lyase NrfEFG subunit NrfF [Shewanella fidelis]
MIKSLIKKVTAVMILLSVALFANATPVDTYQFKSTDNQKRALDLAHSLRCPQCQNQNLIDSNSPVAQDLRLEVYQMVDEGKADNEIIEFMTSRYGEFVLYKPRMEAKTYILWLGPFGLLLFGALIGFFFIRKQRIAEANNQDLTTEDQQELDRLLKRDGK